MKLNPDCIRDILLTVEEITSPSSQFVFKGSDDTNDFLLDDESEDEPEIIYEKLKSYTDEEILYHINQCELSGFFTEVNWCTGYLCFIEDLSPLGHQFLADIRSDTNWNKTKSIAKSVGSTSLSAIKDIAAKIISEMIKSQF
ncbi:DUF2513 domain-containing protein [Clostridium beijerinckii]|uniref:DUF2513 domain-containing protein n=1 Tax=Clostridium beijerinckii TaxID=1520 RepID=UPI000305F35B|nr:DUF2513 domain-containing protein [Clostridium beijerinckii]